MGSDATAAYDPFLQTGGQNEAGNILFAGAPVLNDAAGRYISIVFGPTTADQPCFFGVLLLRPLAPPPPSAALSAPPPSPLPSASSPPPVSSAAPSYQEGVAISTSNAIAGGAYTCQPANLASGAFSLTSLSQAGIWTSAHPGLLSCLKRAAARLSPDRVSVAQASVVRPSASRACHLRSPLPRTSGSACTAAPCSCQCPLMWAARSQRCC